MNKKHLKALPIFLSLPLLMAMYNGPQFHMNDYASYDVTYISHEVVDENYVYTVNVKSNSNYYISSITLETTEEEGNYKFSSKRFSNIFNGYLIAPYKEATISLTSKQEITDFSKLGKHSSAYSLGYERLKKHFFNSETFESVTLAEYRPDNKDYPYEYKVNFKEGYDTNFCCGLFEMTYDNESVFLMLDGEYGDYHFYTYEELDLTKLKMEEATLIEQWRAFDPSPEGIMTLVFIVIGIMVVISAIIFCFVFFFVRYLIRKNKKARADLPL